jgi:hypothetical protein
LESELDGIPDQVVEHLTDTFRISIYDFRYILIDLKSQVEVFLADLKFEKSSDLFNEISDVKDFVEQLELVIFYTRNIKSIFYKT